MSNTIIYSTENRKYKLGVLLENETIPLDQSNCSRFSNSCFQFVPMAKTKILDTSITTISLHEDEYIFLTDIAKYKNTNYANRFIRNWLRNRNTIEFLGTWEKIYNLHFKTVEFDGFRKEAELKSFTLGYQRGNAIHGTLTGGKP